MTGSAKDFVAEWEQQCQEIEALELPTTFRELIGTAAERFGERTAIRLIDSDETLTFAELHVQVNRLASSLYLAGVRKGTHVAVLLPNCTEFPVTWLALAVLGAVMVPTNTGYTGTELDYVYNDADVTYLIIHDQFLAAFESMHRRPSSMVDQSVFIVGANDTGSYGSFKALIANGDTTFRSPEPLSSDDLLNIQYTSGTTGFPKGCMQHQRYWIVIGSTVAALSPDVTSLLSDHPYFYMDPQWQLVWCLRAGATANIAPRMSSSRFWQRVRDNDIDWAWFPMPILKIPKATGERKHTIKGFHAGAISKFAALEAERRFGVTVRSAYGMTEIGAGTLVPKSLPSEDKLDTVGLRAPFRELRIVDENDVDVPDGSPGELLVRGDGVFLGYYNNPVANENSFHNDWFRTGDMFVRDDDGYYRIVSRLKDMIRRSSENISAAEVEHVVAELPEVADAAAVPVPDEYRGEEVKIYIKLIDGVEQADCLPQRIAEHCADRLAEFKIPRYYAYVAEFPYTPSAKIAKQQLIQGVDDFRADSYDRVDDTWR